MVPIRILQLILTRISDIFHATQGCLTNIKSYIEFQETQNEESHVSHVGVDRERTWDMKSITEWGVKLKISQHCNIS
jgi:hypothetical protein